MPRASTAHYSTRHGDEERSVCNRLHLTRETAREREGGREAMVSDTPKLRVLCFHGFRTSAAIFHKQVSRWDPSILELLDLTFLDGPYPARGKSDVEAIFPGPYFEWYQANKDYSQLYNFEESKDFIVKYMQEHGPFDGLMGFSQGAVLAAAFTGLQQKGRGIPHHPPIRFIILVSGAGFNDKEMMEEYYSDPVECPSAHIIGDLDHLKEVSEELISKFKDPVLIRHSGRHTVPRLGEEQTKLLKDFVIRVQSTKQAIAETGVATTSIAKGPSQESSEHAKEVECAKA